MSPDGEWVAFTRRERSDVPPEIRIIPALGGDVRTVIRAASSPAWSRDGTRLVFLRQPERDGPIELTVAGVDGSEARPILRSDGSYPFSRHPAWSRDGMTIAVVRGTGGIAGDLVRAGRWCEPRRAMTQAATVFADSPVFTHDGTGLVFVSNRGGAVNVWRLPLGGGDPVRLTTGPGPDQGPTVAADGSVAFVNSRWRNTYRLLRPCDPNTANAVDTHAVHLGADVSPDSKEIAFSREVDGSCADLDGADRRGNAPG